MENNIFSGEQVRLVVRDPQVLAEYYTRWGRNSEWWRLMGSMAAQSFSLRNHKEWLEKMYEKEQDRNFFFQIQTLEGDRLIGDIGLDGVQWNHGDTFVGIAIGEPEFWGHGYGSDAMRIILRYAFTELNLHRVSLNVFEYNPRAIRSYEKVGFKHEGRMRQALNREGRYWDIVYMGILKSEWERLYRQ